MLNSKENRMQGNGVLVAAFGSDADLIRMGVDDAALLSLYVGKTDLRNVPTTQELLGAIQSIAPEVLYLLAKVNERGALENMDGTSLKLSELMKQSESAGVGLFIIANENSFDHVKKNFYHSKLMDFLTITQRNEYFSGFLKALIEGMVNMGSFARAYAAIAPQHPRAQKGLPLPGSIAVCPTSEGKGLVLWSEAQA